MLHVFSKKLFIGLTAILMLACCANLMAETVAWFPYAHVNNLTETTSGPPWGMRGSAVYYRLNANGTVNTDPNPVWNESRVFISNTNESYYDTGGTNGGGNTGRSWILSIHNSSDINFTSTNRLKIQVILPDGSLAYGNTKYEDSNQYIIRQYSSSSTPIAWDSSNKCFWVTLAKDQTIEIGCWGDSLNTSLYWEPNQDWDSLLQKYNNPYFQGSLRISQANNKPFLASMRGQSRGRRRVSTAPAPNGFIPNADIHGSFGYQGVYESGYGSNNVLCLPEWIELYNTSATAMGWSTLFWLTNGCNTSATYNVKIFNRVGTQIGSTVTVTLNAYQRRGFLPSQFFPVGYTGDDRGYIEIEGPKPIAVALQFRFPKSYYYPSYTIADAIRVDTHQAAEFFLKAVDN